MLHGHLNDTESYAHLLAHPVWHQAFAWLQQLPNDPPLGIQKLLGDEMYVNVMRYDTKPRSQCRFESHRDHIDLQYTIRGVELIDWRRSSELTPAEPYDQTKDVQFYTAPEQGGGPASALSTIANHPGHYAIFFPSDAHRPMIAGGSSPDVLKLVVKIRRELLARS